MNRQRLFLRNIARNSLHLANRLGSGLDKYMGRTGPGSSESLFIVGLPRSGTTLVYELVVQAFKVAFFSKIYEYTFGLPNITTRLVSRSMKSPNAHYRSEYGRIPGLLSPAENHTFWMKWFPESPVLGHHVALSSLGTHEISDMDRLLNSIGSIAGRPFVFKDVYLSLSLEALLGSVKQAKAIVVTREQEAVAASIFKRRSELKHRPWWSIRPPFSKEVEDRDLIDQVAFQCVRSEQLLQQQLSTVSPAQYRIVDYADICRSPHSFIGQMQEWLGSSFKLRETPEIPDRFDIRPSLGFPAGIREEYLRLSASLRADEDHYLGRVQDESLRSRSAVDIES